MDSFFGFDTSLQEIGNDDGDFDGGGKRSPSSRYFKEDQSDEEYDALNDETFGAADKGDWEHIHENLVRLESGIKEDDALSSEPDDYPNRGQLLDDYDLDLHFARFNFYDTNDESGRSSVGAQSIGDEFASKLRLDPSIWDSPLKVTTNHQPTVGLQQVSSIHQSVPSTCQTNTLKPPSSAFAPRLPLASLPPGLAPPMTMMSVEDIERNIFQQQQQQQQKIKEHQKKIQQQQQQQLLQQQLQQQQLQQQQQQLQQQKLFIQQQQQQQQQQHAVVRNQRKQVPPPRPRDCSTSPKECSIKSQPNGMIAPPPTVTPLCPVVPPILNPPQLLAARNALFSAGSVHPAHLLNHGGRLPLALLPPYNLLSAAPFSSPINNLAMHPAFPHAALGPHALHGLVPGAGSITSFAQQRLPATPFLMQPNTSAALQNNQFNQRLVQEIQQNHPLLAFNRQFAGTFNAIGNGSNLHQHLQKVAAGQYFQHHPHQQQYRNSNGIPKVGSAPEHDEYANMMTTREKQWLIGIQLMQLNSDAPYFSDYYFTVFKERLAALKGENRAYKDNQLNHPFTQPKGHAQLLLMSSMAMSSGLLTIPSRQRRSSECKDDGKTDHEPYKPLQFENSLGKLQCMSVTAPRKIIDMEVMGVEERDVNGNSVTLEPSSTHQRKTRHVLLLIETMYRIVLQLEDLVNPTAIEAVAYLREKRERERKMYSENGDSRSSAVAFSEKAETFDDLTNTLIGTISQDKTTAILGVRKGKILVRRILAVLREHPFRWQLWAMIFNALPCLQRKDRDDADGLLFSLYREFEPQMQQATLVDLLRLAKAISPASGNSAVMQCITTSKFLLSAVMTIIFQMEIFYGKNPRTIGTEEEQSSWLEFLQHVNQMIKKGMGARPTGGVLFQSTIHIHPDNNIVRTLRVHFERFKHRVDGSDLLSFVTDNGNSDSLPRSTGNCN